MSGIEIRPAEPSDMDFVTSLSPRLANVPGPAWHTIEAMEGFQDRYMSSTFAPAALEGARTLIAWSADGRRLGAFPGLLALVRVSRVQRRPAAGAPIQAAASSSGTARDSSRRKRDSGTGNHGQSQSSR